MRMILSHHVPLRAVGHGRPGTGRAAPRAPFADGVTHPHIHAAHPLDGVAAALTAGRRAVGKVLLEVAHGL